MIFGCRLGHTDVIEFINYTGKPELNINHHVMYTTTVRCKTFMHNINNSYVIKITFSIFQGNIFNFSYYSLYYICVSKT